MKPFNLKRTLKTITARAGGWTKYQNGSGRYVWSLGTLPSVLYITPLVTKPHLCYVYHMAPGHSLMVAGGKRTVQSTIDRLLSFAHATLGSGSEYLVSLDERGTAYFGAVAIGTQCRLPDIVQSLAIGFLRGEVPGEMLLDAIKHDTDLLS